MEEGNEVKEVWVGRDKVTKLFLYFLLFLSDCDMEILNRGQ